MIRALLHRLPHKLWAAYRGHRILWHVFAGLLTAVLVLSGFDWWFFQETREPWLYGLIMLAGIGGFFIPILVPVALYVTGEWRNRPHLLHAGVAMAQAEAVASIIVAVYKTFTGRIQPEFLTTFNTTDISRNFNFGFFEHGIFWGWPSSHAAVAIAGATALYLAWPNKHVRAAIVAWAVVVSAGAAVGFHWFSDVVAGIIVGIVVGFAVWEDHQWASK
jgi:membrane-associated phospholipid phosphatase